MTDLLIPKPPRPFVVDRNARALAIVKARQAREEEKIRLAAGRLALSHRSPIAERMK